MRRVWSWRPPVCGAARGAALPSRSGRRAPSLPVLWLSRGVRKVAPRDGQERRQEARDRARRSVPYLVLSAGLQSMNNVVCWAESKKEGGSVITLRRYNAGEVIVQENDLGETAYLIGQGRVEVTKELDGRNVHLAYLDVGEIFGEMSMIDEKPRSATVTAVTETVVSELHRDDFFDSFQTQPEVALKLLKILFERLREAGAMILQLQKAGTQHGVVMKEPLAVVPPPGQITITLEGATPQAAAALPVTPFRITQLPFRIGRRSTDQLAYNDLVLPDFEPMQISRHHLAFVIHQGQVGVVDRGSTLGSWVDGQRLGGPSGNSGPVFFTKSEGLLVLGTVDSPFRYRVNLRSQK
jgi:CRP-like cAMP-binding protein